MLLCPLIVLGQVETEPSKKEPSKFAKEMKKIFKYSTFYAAMNDADKAIRRIKKLEEELLKMINSYILNQGPYAVGKMLRLEPDHVEINSIIDDINKMK